jgi:hypothetical protein
MRSGVEFSTYGVMSCAQKVSNIAGFGTLDFQSRDVQPDINNQY